MGGGTLEYRQAVASVGAVLWQEGVEADVTWLLAQLAGELVPPS